VSQFSPDFTRPVANESATVGREARLACFVRNAENYKVKESVAKTRDEVSTFLLFARLRG
jgi:hypothetical protein